MADQNLRNLAIDRRRCLGQLLVGSAMTTVGCVPKTPAGWVDLVWGRRGLSDGRFLKPRAATVDSQDQLYIVDTTGRIQVFDVDGNHLRTWSTPQTENGRPTGLAFRSTTTIDRGAATASDVLLVADTHYYRVLCFDPKGQLMADQQIGGQAGTGPGEFAFVTDAVTDDEGCLYVGEYGDSDRIQKFSPEGEFICQWGGTGREPGRFVRPQSLVVDGRTLWIVDACNHRIAAYDLDESTPKLMSVFGEEGDRPGQFYYPYDLVIDQDGTLVICEYGNQRLQRVARDGSPLNQWGGPGHDVGQLYQPWALVMDSTRRVHVIDSNNHRVQRLAVGAV